MFPQHHIITHLLLQTPGPPFVPDEAGKKVNARIVFVQHGATTSSEDNLLMGSKDEELTTLGEMQAAKAAELLMDLKASFSPLSPSKTAHSVTQVHKNCKSALQVDCHSSCGMTRGVSVS